MNVVLIRPPRVFEKFNKALKPSPPLGIAILAGVLIENKHTVKLIDGIVEGLEQEHNFKNELYVQGLSAAQIAEKIDEDIDVIGVSCIFTSDWIYTKRLLEFLNKERPNAKIILGGEHATALYDICFKECPYITACVLGEGENTLVELLEAFELSLPLSNISGIVYKNKEDILIKNSRRDRIVDIDEIPRPMWDLLPVQTYFEKKLSFGVSNANTLPILATRGCPFRCTFCSSLQMWSTRYYMREVKNVVDEIEDLVQVYGVNNIDLYDLTAIIKEKWILQFCDEILKRGLDITWQLPSGTRSEAITKDVVLRMKESGCTIVTYAPESGSERILKEIKKKVKLDRMLKSLHESYKVVFKKVCI